jgi:hypothetical protein
VSPRRRMRRNKIGGQFSPRLIEMLESHAWREMSLAARRLVERIEIELGHHGGVDNGRLPVTYEDFVAHGIDRHAVAPGMREAEALGFVQVTEHGRAGNAEFRRPNLFRLTFRHSDKQDPTNEWRAIETKERASDIAKKARKTAGEFAKSAEQQQKSSGDLPTVSVGKNPTENAGSLVGKNPTTGSVGKTPLLSISRGGSRSAPLKSAVASEPPRAVGDHLPEKVLKSIMLAQRCSRAAAIAIFKSLPDAHCAEPDPPSAAARRPRRIVGSGRR